MSNRKKLFQYVNKTPIIPIGLKISIIFVCLILLSNFATNFINIQMNRSQIIELTNKILVNRLKEIYTQSINQFEIFKYSKNIDEAINTLSKAAEKGFDMPHSAVIGVYPDATLFFAVSTPQNEDFKNFALFTDEKALKTLNSALENNVQEGSISFTLNSYEYLGIYKYNSDWKCYFICAETLKDINHQSSLVFLRISIFIIILTIGFLIVGFVMFNHVFRNIRHITESLYNMQNSQKLDLLDLKGAPNDDITYLGASFNALSSTINNLLGIFRKFVSRDVVNRAYREHTIQLEGSQQELTILFSDIRSFTFMTETLGNDIINVLNVHYDKIIKLIHKKGGSIGSIIGDAVLAIFNDLNIAHRNEAAVDTAWEIVNAATMLRETMKQRRTAIEEKRPLTAAEKRVFKAVLVTVGVGLDGGTVFYGNIGSTEYMANTVIGDNVNSASRLEGLTRLYKLPIIVSEYIKEQVSAVSSKYTFYEIDTVFVKGKTIGTKIFFPLNTKTATSRYLNQFELFSQALSFYYEGNWQKAIELFTQSKLDCAEIFLNRIMGKEVPEKWRGIWALDEK